MNACLKRSITDKGRYWYVCIKILGITFLGFYVCAIIHLLLPGHHALERESDCAFCHLLGTIALPKEFVILSIILSFFVFSQNIEILFLFFRQTRSFFSLRSPPTLSSTPLRTESHAFDII